MAQIVTLSLGGALSAPLTEKRSAPEDQSLLARWYARHLHQRMLREELLPQPDSVLADARWIREDALRESRKPVWRA
ncbi:MAG: hypothetical protein AAGC57_06535 [Pseudomonadota bacterium]